MNVHREKMMQDARNQGREAQAAGAPISDNPFKLHGLAEEKYAWNMGYLAAEHERKETNHDRYKGT